MRYNNHHLGDFSSHFVTWKEMVIIMDFTREFYLRASDFDKNARLSPRTILELFQDVAGNHAEEIGIGFDALLSRDLLWVVARTKFVIEKQIKRYTTVKVKTWPLSPQRMIFRREYLIYDDKGEIAVRGSSDWMIVNSVTRTLASSGSIFPEGAEYLQELALDEKLRKIKIIEGDITTSHVTPLYTDIDLNGHVNNTKYADFAINAINPENKEIASFQIDYHREVLIGESLNLTTVLNGNKAVVNGENEQGEKKFTCEIIFK